MGDGIPPACLGSLSPPPPHPQEDTREESKLPIKLHWAHDIKDSLSLWWKVGLQQRFNLWVPASGHRATGGRRWSASLDYQSNPFWSTGRRIAIVCNLQRDWTSRRLIPGSRPELKASPWFKICDSGGIPLFPRVSCTNKGWRDDDWRIFSFSVSSGSIFKWSPTQKIELICHPWSTLTLF